MSGAFTVYPAIDLREGRVVRLAQGDYARETDYGDDALALARAYADDGATWLHLVDLGAARAGHYTQHALVTAIKRETGLRVQTGGGVRTDGDVADLVNAGADRIVVGTTAVKEPERVARWIGDFGAESICVALDARQDDAGEWRLPVAGWTRDSGRSLGEGVAAFATAAVRHVLCTDIARDGMLCGPNLSLYRWLASRFPGLRVQASGGVAAVADIPAAREAGAAGVVLGRALLERRFALPEALAC